MVLVLGLIRGRRLVGRDDPIPLTGERFSEEFFLSLTRKVIEQIHPGAECLFRGVHANGRLAFFSAFPHTAQMAGIVVTRPITVRVAPTALR